jgi:S-DNA-T family DNA segregation ATPase FtsK/SpoIIIE
MANKLLPDIFISAMTGSLFAVGLAIAPIIPIAPAILWSLGLATAGFAGIQIVTKLQETKLDKFFREIGFEVNGKYPEIIKTEETDNGCIYTIHMQPGMCSDMFQKMKQAIEQYLKAKISFVFKENLIMSAHYQELKTKYDYELVETNKPLEIMIGYSIEGKLFFDLMDAPHLLVAGTTGGGKSVFLRSWLTSATLLKEDVLDLYLVDMQAVELKVFRKCSSVKGFYTNGEEFEQMMKILHKECNRRRNLFYEKDVDCIEDYNKHLKKDRMKYIVIVIDEYASLTAYPKLLDELNLGLAQFRKFGMRFIIATQHPSVELMKGMIKANIPQRLCFLTASDSDSRMIIGCNGAEKLRGKGHALLKTNELTEIQTMMITPDQCEKLVSCKYVEKKHPQLEVIKNADQTRSKSTPLY